MIQNEEEYKAALEELKHIEDLSKSFNAEKLINNRYPLWIVRQQKLYLINRPVELQKEISEYLKQNPKAGYRISKFKRYRRHRKFKNNPENHK